MRRDGCKINYSSLLPHNLPHHLRGDAPHHLGPSYIFSIRHTFSFFPIEDRYRSLKPPFCLYAKMTTYSAKPRHLPILQYSFLHHQTSKFLPRTLRFPEFRFRNRRRRRLKVSHSFDDFLDAFVSKIPTSTPLDLVVAPALAIFSTASYFSLRRRRSADSPDSDVGSWLLFTSPTTFNRFVLLRCPTISFEDSELLEGVNERLVSENRHFVNLNSGRIPLNTADGDELEGKLLYQRVCLRTDDGGVISLDYPANLDLGKEHGLDTTVLVVPGTAEGSMDRNVRLFVCRALQNGCFPVVMNPRGCAGSPVTTAR